jgi:hypothetical protein
VDVALAGDEVLVTNGVYQTGGRVIYGSLTNRVAVYKPLLLQSVNGPQFTAIQGWQVPGTTNGGGAVRCVYLTNGASLVGFTLTNGAVLTGGTNGVWSGGGLWCESTNVSVSNCVLIANAAGSGGGVSGGSLTGCTLACNFSHEGGGASGALLSNCVLTNNSAPDWGGGAFHCVLNNCTLWNNSSLDVGGGAYDCSLYNCALNGNSAMYGGAVYNSQVTNCSLTSNLAVAGAGAYGGVLDNCLLTLNSGVGAAYGGLLNNCTLTGNSSTYECAGASACTMNNCIVYYNNAPIDANYDSFSTFNYSCTTPLPPGQGNLSAEPLLASTSHLSEASPCRGAGSASFATGTDIDGEPWNNPPSMGCDEYYAGSVTGPLSVSLVATFTNVAIGFPVQLSAVIEGKTTASLCDLGDGVLVTNRPYITHAWARQGYYLIVLRAYNESHPLGVSATDVVHVVAEPVHYVAVNSPNPTPPYMSWATAATSIQDAVDVAYGGGEVVVSNGLYAVGGRPADGTLTNRVAVYKPLLIRSANGPQFTIIEGWQVPGTTNGNEAVRCVYLTNGSSLFGFTLTNGATKISSGPLAWSDTRGGGLLCESTNVVVSNCVFACNSASFAGGGVYGGTLNNCTFSNNIAFSFAGGGAYGCTLNGCRLVVNTAAQRGGAANSIMNACLISGNSAREGGGVSVGAGSSGGFCLLNNCTLFANSAYHVGGSVGGILNNCALFGNSSLEDSGGAVSATLNNCTIVGNSAGSYGGGTVSCWQTNCIIYYNTASRDPNYSNGNPLGSGITYCCTTPQPTNGVGNITNEPLFIDLASSNLRLQSNSPCINAGNNVYAPAGPDLDGNPRIAGGTVDIGAYEFQNPTSLISYAWLQQYGLPTDGSADYADPDQDGMNNWQEWVCGTDPTNALSALRMVSVLPIGTDAIVTWRSVAGVKYLLERSANLAMPFALVATNIVGQSTKTSYEDTNAAGSGPFFYRVGVQAP